MEAGNTSMSVHRLFLSKVSDTLTETSFGLWGFMAFENAEKGL